MGILRPVRMTRVGILGLKDDRERVLTALHDLRVPPPPLLWRMLMLLRMPLLFPKPLLLCRRRPCPSLHSAGSPLALRRGARFHVRRGH